MSLVKLTLSQLEQYLSKAAWILKGPIGASDFKAYIFPMLFFKRISDVYDEEYRIALEESDGDEDYAALPEFHRFAIPKGCPPRTCSKSYASRVAINSPVRLLCYLVKILPSFTPASVCGSGASVPAMPT